MKTIFSIFLLILACSAAIFGQGQDAAKAYFTDTVVVDQYGKTHRLYSDLMEGKVVIVNAFHTECTATVPVMTATLRRLQKELAGRGKEFNIISISVDPADTAARTKAFAGKFSAEAGWYFLTGEKANMDLVPKKFGMTVVNKEDHSTLFVVGNTRTGLWKKVYGLAKADEIQAAVVSVLDDKKQ